MNDSTTTFRTPPTQERAQQTVDRMLDATRALLLENRGAWPTTAAVAQRAGVSIGILYRYFRGQRDLVTTVRRDDPVAVTHTALLRAAGIAASASDQRSKRQAVAALNDFIAALGAEPDPVRSAELYE
ncbi:TetR/AcrR family transcriptional regulator [Rathayibacter tritici]|uniref:TetR/AcrR family transcriptional regulator n=1 Tax=Rathayibacter tritici TaxID=33888 RepID=UPI000A03DE66|nr:TetR/AcrR family transcriptional regulator [Rathayibacter tritici]PPI47441.1 TetR/AcrR family transcriptional regulator [Rathayibacter tritici]